MKTELLLGDEAVGLAAIHAGIAGAFSYPGTPATEIFEFIAHRTKGNRSVSALWSANEKVAYEEALGMSYAGKRAVVSMKHVGLNVAADPFVSSGLTGVNGGLVVVVADDPGMHSSQNEQDSRYLGDFAKVPVLEPGNQQECYDVTREAFDLSERMSLPVLVRIVTRLAHSRAVVHVSDAGTAPPEAKPLPNKNHWTLIPANARRRFRRLLDMQPALQEYSQQSPINELKLAGRRGIIASGIAYNYVREALGNDHGDSLLKIGTYPLPANLIRDLVNHCEEIVVVEEGYPFIESRLNGLLGLPGKLVRGKLDGSLPASGELTPDLVAAAFGKQATGSEEAVGGLPGRPPSLCKGCPHTDTFKAMLDATKAYKRTVLFSDIGCYTLGCMPPFEAVHSCVDMGASISMAHGAAQAGVHPVLCTIGDSTFTHSGMTGLIGAAKSDANMTVFILDNATVAMTGGQPTMAAGEELIELLKGLGVKEDHLHVIEPLAKHHEQNVAVISEELKHQGLSVIVARRPCIQIKKPKKAEPKEGKLAEAAVDGK
ncbi:MAG: indolepyruvate ferredoxin oxidoreductase [Planctomycetes bacterium]|nr:indolepyruvate ferredoxin oxidoreductase [Planctomycetota bacterium]